MLGTKYSRGWRPSSSMVRTIVVLEHKLVELEDTPSHVTNRNFMLNIFSVFEEELPPLKECLSYVKNKKRQNTKESNNTKELSFDILKDELFESQDITNIESNYLMGNLGSIVAKSLLDELRDPKNDTSDHLTTSGGKCSYESATDYDLTEGEDICATNNLAESRFGYLTDQIHSYSTILCSAFKSKPVLISSSTLS